VLRGYNSAAVTTNTRVGPYDLTSLLGAGGMGEVYRAFDARLNRTVAVKLLPPGMATPERLRRFEVEARAASALNHPNILTIHDVGRDGDVAWFATEWVDGHTLRALMNGPRLPISRIIDLAAQMAEGLASAHGAGIVHRDVKPENVMVSNDGLVKIVDFGLAKITDEAAPESMDDARARTATGVTIGTAGYMSPEQASGGGVDHRSDQFALGLVLYEMATRTRPFERPTVPQTLAATIEDEPEPVEARNPEVSPHLAAIIARCLAKAPSRRYESTRDLARELRQVTVHPARKAGRVPPGLGVPWRTRAVVVGLAAVVALITAAGVAWRPTPAPAIGSEPPLLAMRPFRYLSADTAQASFAAGLSDETRAKLSTLAGVRLLSNTAVGGAAGADNRRLVTEFDVDSVLEGTVHIEGQRVRIDAQLVDPRSDRTLWSSSYGREREQALAIPGVVVVAAANALGVSVTPDEQTRVERRPTATLDAYVHYLEWRRTGGDWTDRASHYASFEPLRKAIALDPSFAFARAALAYELAGMGQLYDGADDHVAEGVTQAEAALRYDPTTAEAHGAIAVVHATRGQAGLARLSYQRAIALDPNDTSGMNNLSMLEVTFGRFVSGLDWARRAFMRSGRRGNDFYHVAAPLAGLRDDDVTLQWLLAGERRSPASPRVQQELALLELLMGRTSDATLRAERTVVKIAPDNPESVMARAEIAYLADSPDLEAVTEPLMKESSSATSVWVGETVRVRYAYALARRGERRRAAALLSDAEAIARRRLDGGDESPARRVELAAVAALTMDDAAALDWLSRAYDAGYRDFGVLERDPAFVALRATPRFRATLDAMRRDVSAQRLAAREQGLLDFDALLPAVPAPAK
jgi:eukaryotic-like serine/threonine-protein kinase